jgi:hypothetical protein
VNDEGSVPRTSHALVADDRVYVIDPTEGDGVDERIRALGEPGAVLVLLDRHRRDSDAFARRFGVPVHETPRERIPGAPFEFRPVVSSRFWREVALWWPDRRVLVAADALGTVGYMRASTEPLGVHPLLRPWPPRKAFAGLDPEHVLVGHGEGVHGPGAAAALTAALATSRRGIPRLAVDGVRRLARR